MKILIVDDDEISLEIIAQGVADCGNHEIETTLSATEAFRRVQNGDVSVLLTDWQMPEMSGLELCRKIRAADLPQYVYTVLITSREGARDVIDGLASGADEFLRKPVDPAELNARLHSLERLKELSDDLENRVASRTRELQTAQLYLDDIIASIPDTLLVIDRNGRVSRINQPVLDLLGYEEDELIGRSAAVVLGERAASRPLMERLLLTGSRQIETVLLAKDGREVPVLLSGAPIRGTESTTGGVVCVAKDITSRIKAEEQIRELAFYDGLTGLPNRRLLLERAQAAVQWAQQNEERIGVLFIDIDRFKDINDTLGHAAGDQVLKEVGTRVTNLIRITDFIGRDHPVESVARLGGDEFMVLVTSLTEAKNAAVVARRILESFTAPFVLNDREVFTSASVGIAIFPEDGTEAHELVRNADIAMYSAKSRGRNNYTFYNRSMNVASTRRLEMGARLRRALEHNEFSVHYQPILDCASGAVTGAEALLRWVDPSLGPVSPAEFVPIAEEMGLIAPIGDWVLRTVCTQARSWLDAGHPPIRFAVNVSAHQLRKGLAECVEDCLADNALNPQHLELELTETALLSDEAIAAETLAELRTLGLSIALDDFGTGYSSLSHMRRFPIDRIKIDRSFVTEMLSSPDAGNFAAAIIVMAHTLGMHVTAEGVETKEQASFLQAHGCDDLQGFFFSPGLSASDFIRFLLQNTGTTAEATTGDSAMPQAGGCATS